MQSMRSYGVWKLVEHDGVGHLSVDEVEGTLLIYRIQEEKCMEKERVHKRIRQLVTQLDIVPEKRGKSGANPVLSVSESVQRTDYGGGSGDASESGRSAK